MRHCKGRGFLETSTTSVCFHGCCPQGRQATQWRQAQEAKIPRSFAIQHLKGTKVVWASLALVVYLCDEMIKLPQQMARNLYEGL